MLKPSDIYFSVAHFNEYEFGEPQSYDEDNRRYIAFCPIEYWDKHKCLPDYYFADKMKGIIFLEGYRYYPFSEETMCAVNKPKDEIIKELSALGFTHNKEMEQFLIECWS